MENNIIYTPQFKQWFGDWENNPQLSSKVVDENGVPLIVYHGTDGEFNEFKSKFMGQNGTAKGQGFYFTAQKEYAKQFGANVKAYYLNIRKPLSSTELTITKRQFTALLDTIDKTQSQMEEGFEYGILSDYGDVEYKGRDAVLKYAVDLEMNSSDNDVELIGGIINASGDYDLVTNILFNTLGYDGVMDEDGGVYVIHNSRQAKLINNKTFTDSNRINEKKIKRVFVTEKQFNELRKNILKEEEISIETEKVLVVKNDEKKFFIETEKVLIVKKTLDKMFSRGSMDSMGADGYPTRTNVIGMKSNNGEVVKNMTFEQVLDLLEDKFHNVYTDKEKRSRFLKQVLNDWYNKKISKEGLLSVNTL